MTATRRRRSGTDRDRKQYVGAGPAITLLVITLFALGLAQLSATGSSSAQTSSAVAVTDARASSPADPDPHNETSVAVSPLDDRIIVGVSKVIVDGAATMFRGVSRVAYYYSSDGGNTWGQSLLDLHTPEKTFTRASDPSIAVDLDGNFYIAALMLDSGTFDNGVYVYKSIDGGQTFFDPRPAFSSIGNLSNPVLADKCFITVDTSPASPFRNTIYAVWTNTENSPGGPKVMIRLTYRRPGDTAFSAPKILSHQGDMRGPSVTTGPNGEVYAAWEGIGNPRVILFNASTDGGQNFFPLTVAPGLDITIHDFVGSLSIPNPVVEIDGVPRMNSFPVIDVDRSNGPNRGMIYIAYAESLNRSDSDVYLLRLPPPNGAFPTFSSAIRVNTDGTGSDQFFPWLSVDDSDGSINVAFYDRRDNSGGLLLNTYLARSTDGGSTFGSNLRISSSQTDPRIQSSITGLSGSIIGIGDYIGIAARRGKANLLWTDTRNGKQEVFFGRANFGSDGGGAEGPAGDQCQTARVITSLPFTDSRDVSTATASVGDPVLCSGTQGANTFWYTLTAAADTSYGVDTSGSNYDTVTSVFTGECGALTAIACSDDFGHGAGNRSILTFQARAGIRYLIEIASKGNPGTLNLRVGHPTVTNVEYSIAPDERRALRITGAGFLEGSTQVIVRRGTTDEVLPTTFFEGQRQPDGTFRVIYGVRKKIKKILPPGEPVLIIVESPIGASGRSTPYQFIR